MSLPEYRVHAAIGLPPVRCTPTVIGISVCRVPTTTGLIRTHRGMGIHLSWVVPPLMSMDMGLFSYGSPWCSTGQLRLRGNKSGSDFSPLSSRLLC